VAHPLDNICTEAHTMENSAKAPNPAIAFFSGKNGD
jgi:hypothetical protein